MTIHLTVNNLDKLDGVYLDVISNVESSISHGTLTNDTSATADFNVKVPH